MDRGLQGFSHVPGRTQWSEPQPRFVGAMEEDVGRLCGCVRRMAGPFAAFPNGMGVHARRKWKYCFYRRDRPRRMQRRVRPGAWVWLDLDRSGTAVALQPFRGLRRSSRTLHLAMEDLANEASAAGSTFAAE